MPRWTPESRRKQTERILQMQPWCHATGPRTPEGKQAASRNALKHGGRSAGPRALRAALKKHREFLKKFDAWGKTPAGQLALAKARGYAAIPPKFRKRTGQKLRGCRR